MFNKQNVFSVSTNSVQKPDFEYLRKRLKVDLCTYVDTRIGIEKGIIEVPNGRFFHLCSFSAHYLKSLSLLGVETSKKSQRHSGFCFNNLSAPIILGSICFPDIYQGLKLVFMVYFCGP